MGWGSAIGGISNAIANNNNDTERTTVTDQSGTFRNDTDTEQSASFLEDLFRELQSMESSAGTTSETANTTSQGDSRVSALNEESLGLLRDITAKMATGLDPDSIDKIDVSAVRGQAVQDVLDAGIADIVAMNTNAGTYSNSSTALAAENLGIRASQEGALAAADATSKNNTASLQQQEALGQLVASLFSAEKGANINTTENSSANQNTSGNSTSNTTNTTTENSSTSGSQESTGSQVATGQNETTTKSKEKASSRDVLLGELA